MSNLMIRTENKGTKAPATMTTPEWSPFRMMRDLLNWDPYREMEPYALTEDRAFIPRFEVLENQDHFLFRADVPGVKDADLNITLTGNRLLVTGKRESVQEKGDATYYVYERSYGDFSRAFTLPEGADTQHMTANLTDGVLSIVVPKRPGAQSKKIPVTSSKVKS